MNPIKHLVAATAISTLALPAMAQQTATPADSSAVPSTAAPASTDTPAQTVADTSAQTVSASNNAAQVTALVNKDFPAYDADKSGQLDKNEFSNWILALKADELKTTGKTMAQTEIASWASAAFTSADADKNSTVTKAELGKFLGG